MDYLINWTIGLLLFNGLFNWVDKLQNGRMNGWMDVTLKRVDKLVVDRLQYIRTETGVGGVQQCNTASQTNEHKYKQSTQTLTLCV